MQVKTFPLPEISFLFGIFTLLLAPSPPRYGQGGRKTVSPSQKLRVCPGAKTAGGHTSIPPPLSFLLKWPMFQFKFRERGRGTSVVLGERGESGSLDRGEGGGERTWRKKGGRGNMEDRYKSSFVSLFVNSVHKDFKQTVSHTMCSKRANVKIL